jgi:hypothetical protein
MPAPWCTFKILSSIKHLDNLNEKIRKAKAKFKPFTKLLCKRDLVKHKLRSITNDAVANYYNNLLRSADIKRTWSCINELLGKESKTSAITLTMNDEKVSDCRAVAHIFNQYFNSINNNSIATINLPICLANVVNNQNSFYLFPTDENEVVAIITNLKSLKSTGFDGITVQALKELRREIAIPLTVLINNIFTTGKFPDMLKKALITPVLKKVNKHDVTSYRPISILSNVNKIIEKLMLVRLEDFLIKYGYVDTYQHGFKKGQGTEPALLDFYCFLCNALDKGLIVLVASLDATSAFDHLNHDGLIAKMYLYGIRGQESQLLQNYLENRCHAVKIKSFTSEFLHFNRGVAQGSILGPFLFNAMLDNIKGLNLTSRLLRFADDCLLYLPCKPEDIDAALTQLIRDVECVLDFHKANGLSINASKSQFMVINKNSQRYPSPINFQMSNGDTITQVDYIKYLGCYFDHNLSFSKHTEHIVERIKPVVAILSKLKYMLPTKTLINIYHGHIQSHIMYAISVYGLANDDLMDRIQVLQCRALRSIYKLPFDSNTVDLFTNVQNKILPVRALVYLSSIVFAYKILKKLVTVNFNSTIINNNLRNNGDFATTSFSSTYGKQCFTYSAHKMFNNLPHDLKSARKISWFKCKVTNLIRRNVTQFISCNRFDLLNLRLPID